MPRQLLQETDGFILIEFGAATRRIRAIEDPVARSAASREEVRQAIRRLKENGHTAADAVALLTAVIALIEHPEPTGSNQQGVQDEIIRK